MQITEKNILKKLLADADDPDVLSALRDYGFEDLTAAKRHLVDIFGKRDHQDRWIQLLSRMLSAISVAASPDRALLNFERLLQVAEDRESLLALFFNEPRLLEVVITLFAGSQFLSEVLIKNPHYLEEMNNPHQLALTKSADMYYAQAGVALEGVKNDHDRINLLRRFQRKELLRIGLGDLLSVVDFRAVTRELSNLADAMVQRCLDIARGPLVDTSQFTVLGMGKLGGRELNYSSDIDLVFMSQTPDKVYQQLGQRLIDALTRATEEGFLYRVDMRLRPWGSSGRLTPGMEEYLDYLRQHAQPWEKQALLKSRLIAGNPTLGIAFTRQATPLIFARKDAGIDLESALQNQVHGMKLKIERKLERSGKTFGEVKSGVGSIRDIEFTTQYLQLMHGESHPEILSRNTLDALARMSAEGILPQRNYRIMVDGYRFLRSVEHYLQIMHNQQTHQLPEDQRELQFLARRLGFAGSKSAEQLLRRFQQHRQAIREIYRRYLDSGYASQLQINSTSLPAEKVVGKTLRLDHSYDALFSPEEKSRHMALRNSLNRENPVEVRAERLEKNQWQITIIGYDYLGALSLICGLLFVHQCNIINGHIFTYDAEEEQTSSSRKKRRFSISQIRRMQRNAPLPRRQIIDVFTVNIPPEVMEDTWINFTQQLRQYWEMLQQKEDAAARGSLARLFARALPETAASAQTLLPVDIEIDNSASKQFTVLRIDAPDTQGFLYEMTNALVLNHIYIARVEIQSVGNRAHDTLFVTDEQGNKITDPVKQRQLRVATALVKQFTHLLPHSPNPAAAMKQFQQLVVELFNHPDGYAELASLERPDVLDALARLLGVSQFLWEDFLRMQHANLFPVIQNLDMLKEAKTKSVLQAELAEALAAAANDTAQNDALNAYKDREMFRIDMRYIQGLTSSFWQFTEEISDLAEVVVVSAFDKAYKRLERVYGLPMNGGAVCPVSLCALGKFGGSEMGFASDVELMLLYQARGNTSGPRSISNMEFFQKLVLKLDKMIEARKQGIFEIDLRLRPYGKAGRLAVLLETFCEYFNPDGPAWNYERQSLVRLRPIAGDTDFGSEIVNLRDQLVYISSTFDAKAMRAIREKQIRQLVEGGTINAKFSPGALADIEYLVQGLQIRNGAEKPTLRQTNTRQALRALKQSGIMSIEYYNQLSAAHLFIRRLIEALRMVRGNAKDLTVPAVNSEEFIFLARRLGYQYPIALFDDLMKHTDTVQMVHSEFFRESEGADGGR